MKIKFSSKSVIVLTVLVSLYYTETNETVLFTLFVWKSSWKIIRGEFKSDHKYFGK